MIEKIGNVVLDLKHYSGADQYSDGTVEDVILDIVRTVPEEEYQQQIEEKKSWPVFYHLSSQRDNIVSWLPMDHGTKVLEVGSGMGAITSGLSRRAGSVTCVELSKKRSTINALRNRERDNIVIHVGNFMDIEPELPCDYDYVLLIGVLEYAQSYIGTKDPFADFLAVNLRHVRDGGHLVVAIENKMGMKYWAGCMEDHLGTFFPGIEDYPDGGPARTFTKRGLEELLTRAGAPESHFYYPYPDYKFTDTIYSNERLPVPGELTRNLRNFDGDRLQLFDEKNAFDMVIREGLFPLYSNSYLFITGSMPDTVYARFSNDRDPACAIRTDIRCDARGGREVVKVPQTAACAAHVNRLGASYAALKRRYEGSPLRVNRCGIEPGADGLPEAHLEYLTGSTLEERFDECLRTGDTAGCLLLFKTYLERIRYHEDWPICDYDLIFGNIIISDAGEWTLIDYEWAREERIPADELAYRALLCYQMGGGRRDRLPVKEMTGLLALSEETMERLRKEERLFQLRVTGYRTSVSDMRVLLGRRSVGWQNFMNDMGRNSAEIFEDYGQGYHQENAYRIYPSYCVPDRLRVRVPLKEGLRGLRIDPAESACLLRLLCLKIVKDMDEVLPKPDQEKGSLPREQARSGGMDLMADPKRLHMNGRTLGQDAGFCLFTTTDPNICLSLEGLSIQPGDSLVMECEIYRLSADTAAGLDNHLKRRRWL